MASHWPFESWGRFLPEHTTAVSLLDRQLHHASVVVTEGESCRMREARTRGVVASSSPETVERDEKTRPVIGWPRGSVGVGSAPLAIVWPCRLSVAEYAAAGKHIEVPAQACPDCGTVLTGWSGYWRWLRDRTVHRVWMRRGSCRTCRSTHAVTSDGFVLA